MEYPLELEKGVISKEVNISKALSIVINTELKKEIFKHVILYSETSIQGHPHDQGKCNNKNYQQIIFFLLSCLGICYSSYFKQIHKLYPTQCSSQESSETMSAKSFVLISMAVDPFLNLLACLLYYNVEKSSYERD